MFKLKFGILFFVAILLTGCNSLYYKSSWESSKMRVAEQNILLIKTTGIIKGRTKPYIMKGIVLSLGNGLYLTLTHLSKIPTRKYYRSFLGIVSVKQKVLSEKYSIKGKPLKLIGRDKDISLFRGKIRKRFPFVFGDSNQVEIGVKIWVAGYSYLFDRIVKDGIIASIKVSRQKDSLLNPLSDMFEITAPINPGDSGSPVFAERLGQYEIIGIVDAMRTNSYGMGYAIKINLIKKAIKIILKHAKKLS